MIKKYFYISFFSLALCFNLFTNFAVAAPATNNTPSEPGTFNCQEFKNRFQVTVNGTTYNTIGALTQFCSFADVTTFALNWALILVGTASVIFIILGGYWLIFSAGNEEQAEKGRKVLTNSVIGLIVVIMAAAIVRVVVSALRTDPPNRSTSSTSSDTTTNSASNGSQNQNANNSNSSSGQQTSMFDEPSHLMDYVSIVIDKNNKISISFYYNNVNDTASLAQLKILCKGITAPYISGLKNSALDLGTQPIANFGKPGKMVANILSSQTAEEGTYVSVSACGQEIFKRSIQPTEITTPNKIR